MKPLYPLGQPEKAIGHEPQIDLCVANEQPPALSASGTDPRARYSIKMQRSWKKKMIPPLRGGDFQGIAGLSSDDSLLAENQRRLSGAAQNQASAIAHGGWKSSYSSPLPVEGEIFFLTFPFIDQAISLRTLFRVFRPTQAVSECTRDFSPAKEFCKLYLS